MPPLPPAAGSRSARRRPQRGALTALRWAFVDRTDDGGRFRGGREARPARYMRAAEHDGWPYLVRRAEGELSIDASRDLTEGEIRAVALNGHVPGGNGRLAVLLAIFDFPMLNVGYRAAIDAEPDMAVVADVVSHDALRETLEKTRVDVVVAECLAVGGSGCTSFQAIEMIRSVRPATKILALECRCSSEQFTLALKAGADGFLTREAQPADVVTAIRSVMRGQTYVSPAIVTRMVNTYVLRSPQASLEDAYETLSDREREVLLLAATGHTNREIARTFHLSEQTIHNYRATIMEKLGLHDRVELLKYAIRRGLVNVADL